MITVVIKKLKQKPLLNRRERRYLAKLEGKLYSSPKNSINWKELFTKILLIFIGLAAKYINSFWFPGNAYDAALYFKNKDGLDFKDIDPKKFLSKDVFSAFGAQNVKKWLVDKGLAQPPPKQGGGCGV